MRSFVPSMMLVFLGSFGEATFVPLSFADEPSTNPAQSVQPSIANKPAAGESQRPLSPKAMGSKPIDQEIRELHEDVRVLRRDVSRLIELLEKQPTAATLRTEPAPDRKTSSTERVSESESRNVWSVSDPKFQEIWDLTLNEAILIGLQNSKVMRSLGGVSTWEVDNSDADIFISRVNADTSITEFALAVRNLVNDVGELYWKVWTAHADVASARKARDAAQTLWNDVHERMKGGVVDAQTEAQAREQYFFFRSSLEQSLHDLYQHERKLRHVLGVAQSDGRLICPKDDPTITKIKSGWNEVHENALANGRELIQQRQVVEQCKLQLAAARKDLPEDLLTQLDLSLADTILKSGVPVEHRKAIGTVRMLQVRLARVKARLKDMELNTSHLLTKAYRELEFLAASSQTHFNRATAAKHELKSGTALYKSGKTPLDLVLDSQRRLAQSEWDYHAAIAGHAMATKTFNFRRGTLLEHRGIKLADELSSEDTESDEGSLVPDEGA